MPDRLYDRDRHTQHPRDQQGQPRATCRIVSMAAALRTVRHRYDRRAKQPIQRMPAWPKLRSANRPGSG